MVELYTVHSPDPKSDTLCIIVNRRIGPDISRKNLLMDTLAASVESCYFNTIF
jgi:hypothetical protein